MANEPRSLASQIEGLRSLQPGWDGYSASPINEDRIKDALGLLGRVPGLSMPGARAVPMSFGRLQIELAKGDREVELEFGKSGEIHFLAWSKRSGVGKEGRYSVMSDSVTCALLVWLEGGAEHGKVGG